MLKFFLFQLCLVLVLSIQRLPHEQWKNKRVLFIGAHPDDIEGMAGGLVWLLSRQGTHIEYLVVTNGDKFGWCYNQSNPNSFYLCPDSNAVAYIRTKEQQQAADYLKVKKVHMLNLEDAMATSYPEEDVRKQMTVIIRSVKPDIVISWFQYPDFTAPPLLSQCPKCWGDQGYHPDHQYTGRVSFDAVVGPSCALDLMYPDLADAGLTGWAPSEYYMYGLVNNGITHYVDITGNAQKEKLIALAMHRSQIANDIQPLIDNYNWMAEQLGIPSRTQMAENYIAFF